MAEPIKVYKDGKEFVATSPTGLKQLQEDGWATEETTEPSTQETTEPNTQETTEPNTQETTEPVQPKKRGRPKKVVSESTNS